MFANWLRSYNIILKRANYLTKITHCVEYLTQISQITQIFHFCLFCASFANVMTQMIPIRSDFADAGLLHFEFSFL